MSGYEQTVAVLRILLPVLYAGVAFGYASSFVKNRESVPRIANVALITALVLHAVLLGLMGLHYGRIPFATIPEALLTISFLFSILYVGLQAILSEHRYGALALALNFLVITAGSASLGRGSALPATFISKYFVAHALTTFSAYACFFLSFVLSIMYITQHRQIKDRRLGSLFQRLPALSIMDDSVMKIDAVGTGLLLFGIVAGAFWMTSMPGDYEIPVTKIVFAVLTLTVYGTELVLRTWRGKRGFTPCLMSIVGFVFVLLTLAVGSHGY